VAVGGAAAVCLLSVSGALGVTSFAAGPAGTPATHAGHDAGGDARASTGTTRLGQAPTSQGATKQGSTKQGATKQESTKQAAPKQQGAGLQQPSASTQRSTVTHEGPGSVNASSEQPAPGLPADSGTGKRIVFGVGAQRVWLVDAGGTVVRTYPVSGSKYHNLSLGTYSVTSKSRVATAYDSDERLPFMVRFAYGRTAPIGFHAIPLLPDGTRVEARSELGKPASDGCVREWITDARALWRFAPVGTTVVVHA
jgi:lipoprotein-anchoring transpeptidase ErfK/SrfK